MCLNSLVLVLGALYYQSALQRPATPPVPIHDSESCRTSTIMSRQYSFDSPDADLILRASNPQTQAGRVPEPLPSDFRVHRSILAIASPVFRDIISLPQ